MSLFVLDTDLLTLYYRGDQTVVGRVDACPPTDLAISIMTVDEQLSGWYTLTRQARGPDQIAHAYAQLGEAVVRLARWRILPYTEAAIARVAQLKVLTVTPWLPELASPRYFRSRKGVALIDILSSRPPPPPQAHAKPA